MEPDTTMNDELQVSYSNTERPPFRELVEQWLSYRYEEPKISDQNMPTDNEQEDTQMRFKKSYTELSKLIQSQIINITKIPSFHQYYIAYRNKDLSRMLLEHTRLPVKCYYSLSLALILYENIQQDPQFLDKLINTDDISKIKYPVTINNIALTPPGSTCSSIYISSDITLSKLDPGDYWSIKVPVSLKINFNLTSAEHFCKANKDTVIQDLSNFYQYKKDSQKFVYHPYIYNTSSKVNLQNIPRMGDITGSLESPLSFIINEYLQWLSTFNREALKRPIEDFTGKKCTECNSYVYTAVPDGENCVMSWLTNNLIHRECAVVNNDGKFVEQSKVRTCHKCNAITDKFAPISAGTFVCEDCCQ